MKLSRRRLLQYSAVSGASIILPRFSRFSRVRQEAWATLSMLVDPSATHGYEEGVDAERVQTGDGVVAVMGAAVYAAADAAHGTMGWDASSQFGGGRLVYANPTIAASSGSVYLVPHEVTTGTTATVMSLLTDLSSGEWAAQVRLTALGEVDVVDSDGTRLAISPVLWSLDQRVRLDWRQLWDGASLTLTGWIYVDRNIEGWRPDAVLQAFVPTASPAYVSLGQDNSATSTVGYDTYREYAEATVPAPYEPLVGGADLHTYDEGIDGQRVLARANMVIGVAGVPKYSVAASMHGVLGVLLPPTGGGILRYAVPYPPAHTGSVYVRVAARGGADSRIVTIQNGSVILAQVKLTRSGAISIADPTGLILAQTLAKAKLGRWTRIDWQQTWDGATLALTARYFATNPESPDNYGEIAASLPASETPDTLAVGTASSSWKIQFDTLRTYGDVAAWPDPFDPETVQRAPGMAAWAGDATQTTVEISAYTNDTTSVGLAVATTPDMLDAVFWPSAPPNVAGWNRWSVTGLVAGSRYYHQFTDTVSGGEPAFIGDVSTFSTLQDTGVGCTIRLAVGSCEQNNPAAPYAFDDIAAWAPDRTVHVGDLGYPTNLSRDITTHMNNWSRSTTDPSLRKILAIGCMDYVISDHDDNGTGYNNLPTYHDPVTAASISAWQQVVPARLEDTESPAHGRWRSDVEGNVRFVKLDTRTIDKTDTVTTSTDPHSPDSTMLGAPQLQWLKAQLDAAVAGRQLVILFSDCAWNGTSPGPPIPVTFSDKWPSYLFERDLISDYAAASGAQLFIVFGDSHGLQQDDGAHEKNGFASICCGPLDQDLHMHYQDSYQWNYPADIVDEGGPYRHAQQYQRLTITQEPGSSLITVTADARDCSPVVEGTPMTVSTLTKTYTL